MSREMPSRSLPFGSETAKSPTHVVQSAPPSVLSPQPVHKQASTAGLVRSVDRADEKRSRGEEQVEEAPPQTRDR